MATWDDSKKWQRLRDGSECPICLKGKPNDVLVELEASWVTGGSEAPLPGYVCVVSKRHVVEPFELPEKESQLFWKEVLQTAKIISELFQPMKINYQIHGNTIPHLHLHIFPRFKNDPYAEDSISPWKSLFTRSPQELQQIRRTLQR